MLISIAFCLFIKKIGLDQTVSDIKSETDRRNRDESSLHGCEWSGFVRVMDMVIFQELRCVAKFRGK